MVYGTHGRSGVYETQAVLRLLHLLRLVHLGHFMEALEATLRG